ncbi:MAG: Transcriptional regulator, TetR family [Marmoricola sp.]|nr:Transcriptional regulator, TetR family [Marmoricola sp.]
MKSEDRRTYRMTSRADAASATSERILDAVTELFWERPRDQFVLREVAERAGVTVQTVIRKFGGRDGLLDAAAQRAMSRTRDDRTVTPGDVEQAVEVLLDHYEQAGPGVLRLLAEEPGSPTLATYAAQGRRLHRDWCRTVFAPTLASLSGVTRERRLAQLVAVCDVYTWKLLHLDAGLSRKQTRLALLELLGPLLVTPTTQENR